MAASYYLISATKHCEITLEQQANVEKEASIAIT